MSLPRRAQFFASLFNQERMRKRYPHQDTALSAYLQDIGKLPLLTAEQEAELLARAGKGDLDARQQLVEANLRLVLAIAARFQGRGLAMLDLVQEGNIGLLTAIERFDFAKANRLSTYAKYWIVAAVSRAVTERGGNIQLSSRIGERLQKVRQVASEFLLQDVEPTPGRIAERIGVSVDQVVELLDLMQEPLSLYQTNGDNDMLANVIAAPPLFLTNEITSPSLLADVRQMIEKVLTPDERLVLEYRFGLNEEGVIYDYLEIAAQCYGRTHAHADVRIRQLEKSALAKLRAAFNK